MASTSSTFLRPLQLTMPDNASTQISSTSDSDEAAQDDAQEDALLQEEDTQSAIGVSMSHAHAKLLSPRTPAAEKAAMLEDLDGGGFFDGTTDNRFDDEEGVTQNQYETASQEAETAGKTSPLRRRSDESLQRLPSPWTAGPRVFEKPKTTERDRCSSKGLGSGTTSLLSDLNVKRFVSSFNLPSLPKTPSLKDLGLPNISTVFGGKDEMQMQHGAARPNRANTLLTNKPPWGCFDPRISGRQRNIAESHAPPIALSDRLSPRTDGSSSFAPSSINDDATPSSSVSQELLASSTRSAVTYSKDGRPLRRSTSDQSLLLRRVTSTGSSLGDDTRWENVGQMVNSRMQAFKDSWQDSNIRLPSMPALANMNISSLRPEFFRPRGNSDPRATTLNHGGNGSNNSQRDLPDGPADRRQRPELKAAQEPDVRIAPKSVSPSLDKALEGLTGDLVILGGKQTAERVHNFSAFSPDSP